MRIIIQEDNIDKRVDVLLSELLKEKSLTRTVIQEYLSQGCSVNNRVCKKSYRFKEGDVFTVDEEYWESVKKGLDKDTEIVPQRKELDIRYEDSDLMVLFKPKGLVVHPGVNNMENTLANYIRYYLESKGEYDELMNRSGIVHRLDKGVSGLMVVAKKKGTEEYLKKKFKKGEVIRIYLAELEKSTDIEQKFNPYKYIKELSIEVEPWKEWSKTEGYIGRSTLNRYKMEFKRYKFPGSKEALSYLFFVNKYALVKLETGRMHQIRATLEYLGYSIKGDNLYGMAKGDGSNIMLEAVLLSFVKPDGERIILKTE